MPIRLTLISQKSTELLMDFDLNHEFARPALPNSNSR
jgi:hypothetical protein